MDARYLKKNLSVNVHTCVCSEHLVNANRRLLRRDEVPSVCISSNEKSAPKHCRKPLKDRSSTLRTGTDSGDSLEAESRPDPDTVK